MKKGRMLTTPPNDSAHFAMVPRMVPAYAHRALTRHQNGRNKQPLRPTTAPQHRTPTKRYLDGLGLDTVVCGYDNNDDVRQARRCVAH